MRFLSVVYTPSAGDVVIDGNTFYDYKTAASFRTMSTHMQVGCRFSSP